MTTNPKQSSVPSYRERLIPGPGLFVATALIIPAVALVLTPFNTTIAWPTGVAVYVIIVATLLLAAPTIAVRDGFLEAGNARIEIEHLGDVEALGAEKLRASLGPSLDARSFLLVRGWIHKGVKIENIDPADPAPVWILTTRHPHALMDAISAQR